MTKKTPLAKARAEKKPRVGDERIRPDGSVIRYVRLYGCLPPKTQIAGGAQ